MSEVCQNQGKGRAQEVGIEGARKLGRDANYPRHKQGQHTINVTALICRIRLKSANGDDIEDEDVPTSPALLCLR